MQNPQETLERTGYETVTFRLLAVYSENPGPSELYQILRASNIRSRMLSTEGVELPENAALSKIMQEGIYAFSEYAVSSEILPPLAYHLAKQLCLPRVSIYDCKGIFVAVKIRDGFPPSPENGPGINIDPTHLKQLIARNYRLCLDNGINIPQEQMAYSTICSIGVHEYFHLIQSAIECALREKGLEDGNQDLIYNISLIIMEGQLADFDGRFVKRIQDEMLATSAEFLAHRFFLKSVGVNDEEIDKFEKTYFEKCSSSLNDCMKFRRRMHFSGKSDADIIELNQQLKDIAAQIHIPRTLFPILWEFLGYLAPYNEEELSFILENACKLLEKHYG